MLDVLSMDSQARCNDSFTLPVGAHPATLVMLCTRLRTQGDSMTNKLKPCSQGRLLCAARNGLHGQETPRAERCLTFAAGPRIRIPISLKYIAHVCAMSLNATHGNHAITTRHHLTDFLLRNQVQEGLGRTPWYYLSVHISTFTRHNLDALHCDQSQTTPVTHPSDSPQ